jgi:hypothetical protein
VCHCRANDVRVECSAQTPIRRNDNNRDLSHLPGSEVRIRRDINPGCNVTEKLPHTTGVGARGDDSILRATEPRSGDHFHRLGDLLRALDTADASADFAKCCHCCSGNLECLDELFQDRM